MTPSVQVKGTRENVGRPGLEPGTNSLKGYCSTIELPSRADAVQRMLGVLGWLTGLEPAASGVTV